MKNEFVDYKTALALKELGFDEPCFGYYYSMDNKKVGLEMYIDVQHQDTYFVQAPLFQQVFRWFREKYFIVGYIFPYNGKWNYHIISNNVNKTFKSFKTYEEAELACIIKLIEICQSKK